VGAGRPGSGVGKGYVYKRLLTYGVVRYSKCKAWKGYMCVCVCGRQRRGSGKVCVGKGNEGPNSNSRTKVGKGRTWGTKGRRQ